MVGLLSFSLYIEARNIVGATRILAIKNDRPTMSMRPSLFVLVAFAIGASPPTRTNGRLPTNPHNIHVCGRPFVWVEGWALAPNAAHGRERLFDGTRAGNSRGVCGELQVLLVLFLRCRAHTPSLTNPFSGRCSSSRGCRLAGAAAGRGEGKFSCVLLSR